jgi:hypothetical protein
MTSEYLYIYAIINRSELEELESYALDVIKAHDKKLLIGTTWIAIIREYEKSKILESKTVKISQLEEHFSTPVYVLYYPAELVTSEVEVDELDDRIHYTIKAQIRELEADALIQLKPMYGTTVNRRIVQILLKHACDYKFMCGGCEGV